MNSAGDHKCHDTHKHTSHRVGHIVVAAVNGGGSNAQRGDAEEKAEAWHIGADCTDSRSARYARFLMASIFGRYSLANAFLGSTDFQNVSFP